MGARSIAALNQLPDKEKSSIYARFIPPEIFERFELPHEIKDLLELNLLQIKCKAGSTDVVLELRHDVGFQDPLLYAHLTDTVTGQIHVLLYVMNDPYAPRYDTDMMPDGKPTEFGIFRRNLEAERAAMKAGLAPGQVRQGLKMLKYSVGIFEEFVDFLGHEVYFIDPLFYHNAIVFERYGFAYQQGRRKMEEIHSGFTDQGELISRLDGSSPFRSPEFSTSIRGRSWAIHDCILGEPFTDVVMYKAIGSQASVNTFPNAKW